MTGGYCATAVFQSVFFSLIDDLGYPIYGVPTIRSDIPAPRIRRVSDMNNYGEEGNAYALLHPSIFSQKGVFERDFFKTRSKEEVQRLPQTLDLPMIIIIILTTFATVLCFPRWHFTGCPALAWHSLCSPDGPVFGVFPVSASQSTGTAGLNKHTLLVFY